MIGADVQRKLILLSAFTLVNCLSVPVIQGETHGPIDFARQVRPLLSDNCFLCHGPDEESREAELRLDRRADATADRGGYAAVVPGDMAASELVARITSDDDSLVMPPSDSGKALTAAEVEVLERWVQQGAPYADHWAFVAPRRPALPKLADKALKWVRNPIDYFVIDKLEREGLTPSPIADRITLLRRLHLDVKGLPPTIEEIEQFLADSQEGAYKRLIEKLIASPHYGERWGRHWLDAARYADSDGYEKDLQRTVWPYRDWVIDALNADKPYDQFIVEQIAGDMLPNATKQQIIATGFLRNSMVNEEGGADPEQFRIEGLFDRMDAIGKAVLGLTTQCAQCHTHKYDPLTQSEYYGMFAFLNNCVESFEVAYIEEQAQREQSILERITAIEDELRRNTPDWREQLADWAQTQRGNQPKWVPIDLVERPFEGEKFRRLDDLSILSESFAPPKSNTTFSGYTNVSNVTAVRLELLTHPQLPGGGPGRSIDGTAALSEFDLFIAPRDGSLPRAPVKFSSVTADVNPAEKPLQWPYLEPERKGGDKRRTGPVEFTIDDDEETAWTTDSGPATRHQSRKAVFVAAEPFGFAKGSKLSFHLRQRHGGNNASSKENYLMGRYRFSITTVPDASADPLPARLRTLIDTTDSSDWTNLQWGEAFSYWRTTVGDWSAANAQIDELLADFPDGDFQLVTRERSQPRTTYLLKRGDFLNRGEIVEPHTPEFLHPLPENAPPNRLSFSRWLVDRQSPTTARTIVNRVWQAYFGIGLIETPEDLGMQSPAPSHPQLLDWLAVEFMESGWSFKHLHRLILNSAVYRQSSNVTPDLSRFDPRNRLLARGPRVRVDAEIVRDIALAASGLLNTKVGGPSVYPPAPEFLFLPPASYGAKNWFTAAGEQDYRRSLYVHAYRTVPYPPLQNFDAPNGDAACVRRTRSNTPLQALTLLNETQFVQCSRALAKRIHRETSVGDDASGLRRAFRLCVARLPDDDELRKLQILLDKTRIHYRKHASDAQALVGKVSSTDGGDPSELAAWTVVCRAILNLDETITKQ